MSSRNLTHVCLTACSLVLLSSSAQAAVEQKKGAEEPKQRVDACTHEYNGIRMYGEFLCWQVMQDQMQYAAVVPGGLQSIVQPFLSEQLSSVSVLAKLSVVDPSFEYKPGFRIGLGYDAPSSSWNFQLAWTRIHETVSSSVYNDAQGVVPLTLPIAVLLGLSESSSSSSARAIASQATLGSGARSHWNFEFDTIDMQIGRNCSVREGLDCFPYLGVKGALIKQNQRIEYLGFSYENIPLNVGNFKKNNFYGIGPSFGLDSSWEFCPHWNLSSGVCGALLYGKFNVSEHPSETQGSQFIKVDSRNSRKHLLRPTIDANIGLDWSGWIHNKCQMKVGVSYEVQYWWNQWQAPPAVESSLITGGISPQGDLMMQGFTAQLAFLF